MGNSQNGSRPDRYRVKVAQYIDYHRDGFIVVRGLASRDVVDELKCYADDMLYGRIDAPGARPLHFESTQAERYARFSRIHMIHRHHAVAEKHFLYPPVIDVLEALIGPDVLALQTMMFLNPPGMGGQGWHQDAYYIPSLPDTLIGAWMALDRADEENGCLWVITRLARRADLPHRRPPARPSHRGIVRRPRGCRERQHPG